MKRKNRIKISLLLISLIAMFSCSILYGKSIDLNGVKINLNADVSKEHVNLGKYVNNEKEKEELDKKDNKEPEDKYVKIDLVLKNYNPYEALNVTVEEIAPTGFRQLESKKNDTIINERIEPKLEKKIEYTYRYHYSFLKDQNTSILYDEDGLIIDKNNSITYENSSNKNSIKEGKKLKINGNKRNGNFDEAAQDLKKGLFDILKFIIIFVVCVSILYAFIMVYKTIKGNDDNYFNDYDDPFKCFLIILFASIVINLIFNKNIVFAEMNYTPQIYEYGKSYERVIYEPVYFNDRLYRFAYKISVSFESSYIISDEDYENDTDGDGLIDAFEYQYMTDKNNVDTDSDGINDYLEVMFLDYNPLSEDTFNDGIKDGDRDFDNDKLTNIEEINYGTDLNNIDTDYDKLTDYEEINVYNTNPLSIDTDEDLLSDSDELKLGTNPTNPRTDGVTLDSERKIEQEYPITNVPEELREGDIYISKISGFVSGNIDNEVKVRKKNNEVFNTMSSFVQSGFEVELKENEKITVELDVNKVLERKTTLTIVRYEDGKLEVIDTICEGDKLKADIGSGVYTVMDSDIVLRDLSIFIGDYIG